VRHGVQGTLDPIPEFSVVPILERLGEIGVRIHDELLDL